VKTLLYCSIKYAWGMPLIVKDGKIVKNPNYDKMVTRQKYWRLSYDCYGPDYIEATDGEGINIIRKHEREDDEDYLRRKQSTIPYCFVGPILRRYNDFIFRKPADIDKNVLGDFFEDVDALGSSENEFMSTNLLNAQIDRTGYILVDFIGSGEEKTTAQAQADGDRFVWKQILAPQVVQSTWFQGRLVDAAILMKKMNGTDFIWYVTPTTTQEITVKVDGGSIMVLEVFPETPHTYGGTPLVPNRPKFGTISQAAPIAELQKGIARLRSFLIEEMAGSTFSQMVIIGASAENASKTMKHGPHQAIYIPEPTASMQTLGADVAQAGSIRQSILDDSGELHRVAGISSTDNDGGVESGLAKSFTFNDLSANLSSLAKSTQDAHQRAEQLTANAMSVTDFEATVYPSDFNMPMLQMELAEVVSANSSNLPRIIKDKLIKRFVNRNLELTDEDKKVLEQQLADSGVLPGFANQFAERNVG